MSTYDTWKATDPQAEELGDKAQGIRCPKCGKYNLELWREVDKELRLQATWLSCADCGWEERGP